MESWDKQETWIFDEPQTSMNDRKGHWTEIGQAGGREKIGYKNEE